MGGNANSMFCVGGKANSSVFKYQHIGIANANFHVGPNASIFLLQWNIGFKPIFHYVFFLHWQFNQLFLIQ